MSCVGQVVSTVLKGFKMFVGVPDTCDERKERKLLAKVGKQEEIGKVSDVEDVYNKV